MSKKKKRGNISHRSRVKREPKLVKDITGLAQWRSDVLESEKPVVVDFWAPWCAPCRAMGPIIEEAARIHKDSVMFAKLNTQSNQQIARELNIRSIPTLIVFYHGEVFDVSIGLTPGPRLQKMIKRVLDTHEGTGFFERLKKLWSKTGEKPAGKKDQVE